MNWKMMGYKTNPLQESLMKSFLLIVPTKIIGGTKKNSFSLKRTLYTVPCISFYLFYVEFCSQDFWIYIKQIGTISKLSTLIFAKPNVRAYLCLKTWRFPPNTPPPALTKKNKNKIKEIKTLELLILLL